MAEHDILRILRTQNEAIIAAISGLAEAIGNQTTMLETLNDWLREPSGSDLTDTLDAIAGKLDEIKKGIDRLSRS